MLFASLVSVLFTSCLASEFPTTFITLAPDSPFKIKVRYFTGAGEEIRVHQIEIQTEPEMPVLQIKQAIATQVGIPYNNQLFVYYIEHEQRSIDIYPGKDDHHSLAHFNIPNGAGIGVIRWPPRKSQAQTPRTSQPQTPPTSQPQRRRPNQPQTPLTSQPRRPRTRQPRRPGTITHRAALQQSHDRMNVVYAAIAVVIVAIIAFLVYIAVFENEE